MDRRVEITGPVDRKMIINALNSGANVFMADFEDSNSPTWRNNVDGQLNLRDAVNGTITFTSPEGKQLQAEREDRRAAGAPARLAPGRKALAGGRQADLRLAVRFRPVLLPQREGADGERHGSVLLSAEDGEPSGSAARGTTCSISRRMTMGVPRGTIRATVLIETILAAFEMDEILYELRDHSAGLNCGRWDYIFSFIKKFRNHPDFVLPNRAQVTMDRHFLKSYVQLLIQTCHRRGIHAMGGMAAQIPIKNDPAANETGAGQSPAG